MKINLATSALVALALSVVPSIAVAGHNTPSPDAASGGMPAEGTAVPPDNAAGDRRARILQRIETIRIAKMTEALNLDQATAEKFFPALQPFTEKNQELVRDRMQTNQALRQQLDAGAPDPTQVAALLDKLSADQKAISDNQQAEYEALKKVVDPVTLAKYYRFQQEFQRNMQQLIQTIRRGENGGGGGGAAGPNGGGRRRFRGGAGGAANGGPAASGDDDSQNSSDE